LRQSVALSFWVAQPFTAAIQALNLEGLKGCGKTLFSSRFGNGTISVVPLSRLDFLALQRQRFALTPAKTLTASSFIC
jgi:hypothetical protein